MKRWQYRWMGSTRWSSCLALAMLAAGGAACGDPVSDARIDALGGEAPGVSRGPTHRPGQPCLACHSEGGAGEGPLMSVAGTIYQKSNRDIPAEGARIDLTDARGDRRTVYSNCAGNFYVESSGWEPMFPMRVEVGHPWIEEPKVMESKIGREGACSSCHALQPGPTSAARVYLVDDPAVADWPWPPCDDEDNG